MIMCKGLLSSVDYVRVESMSPSVESTCCPQHNLTSSNPLPLTPSLTPLYPPYPPLYPLPHTPRLLVHQSLLGLDRFFPSQG